MGRGHRAAGERTRDAAPRLHQLPLRLARRGIDDLVRISLSTPNLHHAISSSLALCLSSSLVLSLHLSISSVRSLLVYRPISQGLNVEIESVSHSSNRVVLNSLDEMTGVEESMLSVTPTPTLTITSTDSHPHAHAHAHAHAHPRPRPRPHSHTRKLRPVELNPNPNQTWVAGWIVPVGGPPRPSCARPTTRTARPAAARRSRASTSTWCSSARGGRPSSRCWCRVRCSC